MVSTRCFSSFDGQYIVNLYFDAELYKRQGERLIFVKNLGKLKNPYNAAFSPDGSRILVKNNNALIEIYEASSFKKVAKTKAPKDSKYVYFWNNDMLIFSTESGILYTLDICTNDLKQHFCFDGFVDANLYLQSDKSSFIFTVFDEMRKETHIYQIGSNKIDISMKILLKVNCKILENGVVEDQNCVYFVTPDNTLCFAQKNNSEESLSHHKVLYELTNPDTIKNLKEYCADFIKEFPIMKDMMLENLVFKGVCIYKNYLLIAVDGGFLIFSLATMGLVQMTPSKIGIENIHFIKDNGTVIICSGFGSASCLFDDLIKGVFSPCLL